MELYDEDILSGNKRFALLKRLGEGGMGVVYLAHDNDLDIQVALKTLKESDSETLLRLKKEFRSLQGLRHPNLISFGELFEEEGRWFFTMDYIDGVDFLTYVREENALRELNAKHLVKEMESVGGIEGPDARTQRAASDEAAPVSRFHEGRLRDGLTQLGIGLLALHAQGRLHRDIKPDNILVEKTGRVVLMDFGLVTESEQNMKTMSRFFPVGTSSYMSPEQAASSPLTPASDWYSVGVVLFRALTGRLPFEGTFTSVVLEKQRSVAPSPRTYNEHLPEDLCLLCEELLQFDPGQRPSGPEIVERLQGREVVTRTISHPSTSSQDLFVGREVELERLREAFSAYRQGVSQVVLLHGPSGLGKTTLARHFLTEMTQKEERLLILSGRCNEQESVSFNAFDQLIDTLSQVLRHLPEPEQFYVLPKNGAMLTRLFPVLSRVRTLSEMGQMVPPSGDPLEFRAAAFAALKELLLRLSDRYLVCLFIDNYQWADADSNRLLSALVSAPNRPSLFLILGQRTMEGPADVGDEQHEELVCVPCGMVRISLGPLTAEESAQLAGGMRKYHVDGGGLTPDVIRRITEESHGHPLFIQELVRHTAELGDEGGALPFVHLDEVLWQRVMRLGALERQIIQCVSLARSPFPLRSIAELLETPAGEVLRGLQVLQIAHLVKSSQSTGERRFEPFHDRVRAAVRMHTDPDEAQNWHRRLAYAFKALPDTSAETLGHHFELAGDAAQAAVYFAIAGHVAGESLAFTRAAGLFRRALTLKVQDAPGSQEESRALRLHLSSALASAGLGREAAHELLLAIREENTVETLELQQRAGMLLLRAGYFDEGLKVLHDQLRAMHIHLPKPGWRTLLALGWRRLRLRLRGLSFREHDESEIPGVVLARLDLLKVVSRTVESLVRASMYATRWVHEALNVGEPTRILQAACIEANYLAATGNFDTAYARKVTELIRSVLAKHDIPLNRAYLDGAIAYSRYMEGRFSGAYTMCRQALDLMEKERDSYWEQAHMHFIEFWSLFYLGEIKGMSHAAVGFFNDAMARGDVWSASGALLGLPNLAFINMNGPDQAEAQANELMSGWSKEGYHLQHFFHFLTLMHVSLYRGEPELAHRRFTMEWNRLKGSQLLYIPSVRNEAIYTRGHVCLELAKHAPQPEARRLLRQARRDASQLAAVSAPWPRSMSEVLRANVELVSGASEKGIEGLRGSLETFTSLDMKMHAAAVRLRLADLVGGDEGSALRAVADAWAKEQEIRDPEALTRMLIP